MGSVTPLKYPHPAARREAGWGDGRQKVLAKRTVGFKWVIIVIFFSIGALISTAAGISWYRNEKDLRVAELIKLAKMSLKPIVMVSERSIAARNYYILDNQDYLQLFRLVPSLEFFRIEGTSDADEPFEFSYCPKQNVGSYSKYPKLYKILPEDSSARREKKETLNRKIMEDVETYDKQIAVFKRPPELDESDIYFDGEDNHLYLSVNTNNKNGGGIWAMFDASDLSQVGSRVLKKVSFALMIAIVPMIALAIVIGRLIAGPLGRLVHQLVHQVEHLDFSKSLAVLSRFAEINQAVEAMNLFIEKLRNMIKDIASNADTLSTASSSLSDLSHQMTTRTDEMSVRSNAVATAAEEMSSNMTSVADATEQASKNVHIVATAAEQMTSSINDVAKNSEKARAVTGEAVSQARRASDRVDELGRAAEEIGKVTETINEISEQTNLLALNATIEAARAGEAGKGFAVVANEIKELARQTASATEEIKKEIEGIQASTADTVREIGQISQVINEVNEIVSSIAGAVEEQSVTTKEIANSVAQASTGIQEVNERVAQSSSVAGEIAKDIAEANQSAGELSNSSSQVSLSAQDLSRLAEQLKEMVGRFKV
jgi:methyl-accepting chemotaxis protein